LIYNNVSNYTELCQRLFDRGENVRLWTVNRAAGLFQWQVADEVGVNEVTFIRWLRKPLPEEKKHAIIEAIQKLGVKRKEDK
jgi:hypothetical protein